MSIASWTSPPASARTLPISCVIRSVSASFSCSSSRAKRKRISPRFGPGTSRRCAYASFAVATARSTSSAVELRDEPAHVHDPRVPGVEGRFELVQLVPAAFEANRLARVRRDAVLVPREVPGDRHGQLAGDAGQRNDARPRLAEALRDSSDGAPVRARVEEVCGLEHGNLVVGEATQDRLGRGDRLAVRAREAEELAEPAATTAAGTGGGRLGRSPLLDPSVLGRRLLAQRADVDELRALLRGEAHRALAEEQRPFADGALPQRRDLRHAHSDDYSPLAEGGQLSLW